MPYGVRPKPTPAAPPAAGELALSDGAVRLLDVAERFLAEHGTTGWSLRQVTLEAGHHNSSAVAYHFGGRQQLIDAVWHRRTVRVNVQRAQMLADLDRDGRPDDLAGLVRAHLLPIAHEMARCEPSYWARVNEARLAELPLDFVSTVSADLGRFEGEVPLEVLMALFVRLRGQVAVRWPTTAGDRVGIYTRSLIGALAAWEREVQAGRRDRDTLSGYSEDLVDLGVAVLLV